METVIKYKSYKSNDLFRFGKYMYFEDGFNKTKIIEINEETYDEFIKYFRDFVKECKKHNIQIEINKSISDIRVCYETKIFNW